MSGHVPDPASLIESRKDWIRPYPRESTMRVLLMFLLGLATGAVAATMAVRALSEGNEFPHGVMALMSYHVGELGDLVEAGHCDAPALQGHVATLGWVAQDIEAAFLPTGADDSLFGRHARTLRDRIQALPAGYGDCPAFGKLRGEVGAACKACHQDFRS
ncbi:MAG TPA: hypothetical protein VFG21_06980 [Xanthomonadaceae bacterium]|nr:hypothetical protein [Xanthomonadaceae bacterium]